MKSLGALAIALNNRLATKWGKNYLILLFVVLAVVMVILMISMLSRSASIQGAKDPVPFFVSIVAAMGVLGTAMVTLCGLLLKDSIDNRTILLHREAETRLKMESSLKAIELMTPLDRDPSLNKERRQGAIIALINIGQLPLALSLLEEYMVQGYVSLRFSMRILDQAFQSNDHSLKEIAANLIHENADKLSPESDDFYFPDGFKLKWNMTVELDQRRWILEALVKCMLSRPMIEWKPNVINQFAYTFYKAMIVENEKTISFVSAAILQEICRIDSKVGQSFIPPDKASVRYVDMEDLALEILPDRDMLDGVISVDSNEFINRVSKWARPSKSEFIV